MLSLPDWSNLSLAEQVAQMVVVRASGHLFDQQIQYPEWEPPAQVLQHWVKDLQVGGVLLLGGSAAEVRLRTHQLQGWATIPLLIAADIEEGVGQRFAGATWFPPPMAIGAIARQQPQQAVAYAEQMGAATAQEALAIGINWILAPVVDVNNNPANPVINVRAWADSPDTVSHLTTAFLRGAQRYPALTTAKHFPGHGDTAIDSHLELPTILHSRDRLAEVEFPPFQTAIAAGVDAVMTAHLHIPALDAANPATLSPQILTDELRQTLGFNGLIVTDALVMGAITDRYGANEAPVLAVEAGADLVLMPVDPEGAIQAICAAVETGRIPLDRIHASLQRIWQAKAKVCVPEIQGGSSHAWEQLPPPDVQTQFISALAQPPVLATATGILRDSMQVYHPTNSRLDQPKWQTNCRNLILIDDRLNSPFLNRQAPAITYPRRLGYDVQTIDRYVPCTAAQAQTQRWQPTLLQVFLRGNPFRGNAGLSHSAQEWFELLVQSNQIQALVIYGSPYSLEQFLPQLPPDVPYIFSYGQMAAAQTLSLEALFSADALPVPVGASSSDRTFTD
ncbi:MAG: hydrolase [Elainellaceae cyanobacterium]